MERFITFIKNNETHEEFISMRKGMAGAHENVMKQEAVKYPHPKYTVHTAYTDIELRDILETLDRWTGTKVMSETPRLESRLEAIPHLIHKLS